MAEVWTSMDEVESRVIRAEMQGERMGVGWGKMLRRRAERKRGQLDA